MAKYVVLDQRNISSEDFDGEMVAVNFDSGKYYGLKGCASDIWRLLETPTTTQEVVASLASMYDKQPDDIAVPTAQFMDQLGVEGILVEADVTVSQQDTAALQPTQDGYQPPELEVYSDLQELILLDPVHEVNVEQGWPIRRAEEET